ncbi:MAG: hypothetical protein QGI38_00415 [Candidatus Woesearchaeota archaeon]|jgi:hypothetical protein|nr:hypothetical protein [Candidatus Woesearchaeota archaeon]|tara:strand:- start:15586 stop:16053 length:468 start_codon:yes stop_codon:yes gene_type:complete
MKMKVGYKRYKDMDHRYKAFIDDSMLSEVSKEILREWANERRANNFRDNNNLGLIGQGFDVSKMKKKNAIIDLYIDNEIALELKIAESIGVLDRCSGQIERYVDCFDKLAVLILDVGKIKDLKIFIDRFKKKGAKVFVIKGTINRRSRTIQVLRG